MTPEKLKYLYTDIERISDLNYDQLMSLLACINETSQSLVTGLQVYMKKSGTDTETVLVSGRLLLAIDAVNTALDNYVRYVKDTKQPEKQDIRKDVTYGH